MSSERPLHEMRSVPLRRRLAAGAAVGLLLGTLVFALSDVSVFRSFENRTLDWRQRLLARPTEAVDRIAIVAIDDYSIREARSTEGFTWPWPRDVYEALILFLRDAGARGVVFDVIFADPSASRESDEVFAAAAKEAGNVSVAAKLDPWPSSGGERDELAVAKARIPVRGWTYPPRGSSQGIISPIPELGAACRGVGVVNVVQDPDNTLRRADIVVPHGGPDVLLASLGLEAARYELGRDVEGALEGRSLRIGERRIPLGDDGRLLVRYYGPEGTFRMENAISVLRSFVALQEGKKPYVDPAVFKDRIVFIAVDAAGLEDVVTAPVSTRLRGVEFHATVCANILGGEFLRELPPAYRLALLLVLGLVAGLSVFAVWRAIPAILCTALIFGTYSVVAVILFRRGLALELFHPVALLGGLVFVAETLMAYVAEGRQKREVAKAFGQYMSPIVIRDLMQNPDALKLGGETREITVFFSDIQGFSTFSEGMTSEELVAFLNVYLSAMTDVILDHRGLIDKYEGDAIMAFWGAPLPTTDHALQACLAALEQRRALGGLNEKFEAEGRPRLNFRAGLNMGAATVGNMGSSRRFAYTAMGDVVNLASRLEGANKFFGTSVMISDAVRRAAGDAIVARRLGKVRVVGKSIPTVVHELLGRAGDLGDDESRRLSRYHEALDCMEGGRSGEAAAIFRTILAEVPDPMAKRCLGKCEDLERLGLAWDGVWVLESKG